MIIGLNFDRHLGSGAVEVPVYFPGDRNSLNPNLAASSLHEILLYGVHPLSEERPKVSPSVASETTLDSNGTNIMCIIKIKII